MALLDGGMLLRNTIRSSDGVVVVVADGQIVEASGGFDRLIDGRDENRVELLNLLRSRFATAQASRVRVEGSIGVAGGIPRSVVFDVTPLDGERGNAFIAVGGDPADSPATSPATPSGIDAVSGLPDRFVLEDRLGQALLLAQRQRSTGVLMILQFDGFAELSRPVADEQIREVGARLRRALRDSDTLARSRPDEFAVILPPPADSLSALAASQKLLDALSAPVAAGHTLAPAAMIGLAQFPDHARSAAGLLECARAAVGSAREAASVVAMYAERGGTHEGSITTFIGALKDAIATEELDLTYQPSLRLSDMSAIRAEALLRWPRATGDVVRAAAFVHEAQHAGLGRSLTAFVLRAALRRCRKWRAEGFNIGVTINIGLRDLFDDSLPGRIASELEANALEPRILSLDIREEDLGGTSAVLERRLRALKQTGVRLALDDFGSRGASLRLLQRMPFSEVKLDRRHVADICTNIGSWSFVRSAIDAAHGLGLEVTAEGVEDGATSYVLGRLGCDTVQGHYLTGDSQAPLPFLAAPEIDSPLLGDRV